MKLACLIIAFDAAPVLARSLPVLNRAGWDIFIHLDRKADRAAYLHVLGQTAAQIVFVEDPLDVFWGGYSMVQAEIKLLNAARAKAPYDSYLLLSDDSFPVLPSQALAAHFASGEDLITMSQQPEHSPFFARYHDFSFYDHPATMIRNRGTRPVIIDEAFEQKIAEIAVLRRLGKKAIDVYYGSQFWSLTAESVNLVLSRIENDMQLVKSFEYSALPDELMFQSILGNFKYKRNLTTGPVYADFSHRPAPRVFAAISDLPYDLQESHAFIRKVSPHQSGFLDDIQARLLAGKGIHGILPGNASCASLATDESGGTHTTLRLSAPETTSSAAWHGVESFGGRRYRWTGSDRVSWSIEPKVLPPGVLRFVITTVIASTEDFVENCRLEFNGQSKPLRRNGAGLTADFVHNGIRRVDVELHTPPLKSPRETASLPDDRKLGLSVAM